MNRAALAVGVAAAAVVALLAAAQATAQTDAATAAVGADSYRSFTRPSLSVMVASRAEGLVEEVLVEEGQTVTRGQVLLRLDSTVEKLDVELSRLRAETDKALEAARLVQEQKSVEVQRARTLIDKGSITGTELEQRELELKIAVINVQIAEANAKAIALQLRRDEARLAQREIVAPADGVVTRLHKKVGEAVQRLETAAELVQLDPLEIVLNLPMETRGQYVEGQKARVRLADDPAVHEATVRGIDAVGDFASNTYRLKVRLPNPEGRLQAGRRATVDLSPR
jgi:RND family efflux transporter MFP subunit